MGRVRESRPVSTRPRRPCPLFRCKVQFQRDNGIIVSTASGLSEKFVLNWITKHSPSGAPGSDDVNCAPCQKCKLAGSVPHIDILWIRCLGLTPAKGLFACSLVPMGRVRASSQVSTRPRRPCPLILRSTAVLGCDSLAVCRSGGLTNQSDGLDERRGISQSVGMMVGSLLGKELQSPPIVLP